MLILAAVQATYIRGSIEKNLSSKLNSNCKFAIKLVKSRPGLIEKCGLPRGVFITYDQQLIRPKKALDFETYFEI
jgi:hypothetical protein